MRLNLTPHGVDPDQAARLVSRADVPELAHLMIDAYRGTIDDEGETLEEAQAEMRATMDGKYGEFLSTCSFAIELDGVLVSACLVTFWEGMPLIAFTMTHPDRQNRGLLTEILKRSINAMIAEGHEEARLLVTKGNLPAVHVYERLGFQTIREV
jgi:ribosomal protein S18 acetylase RimI-like enzyme